MTIEINKEYQWNQFWASRFANNTDINKVVLELKDIEDVHGKINPELIVESSKNKKSVLHSFFEWDNEKAAEKWRLRQATILLGRIEVKILKNGESKIVKVFEISKRKSGFNNSQQIEYSRNVGTNKFIIMTSIEDLNRVRNRLDGHELVSPIEYIDKALAELQLLKNTTDSEQVKPENKLVSVG